MRTTVVIPPEMRAQLRRVAVERGVSMAELIREGAEEVLRKHRPKPRSGIFASGHKDTGKLAGEINYEPDPWR